MNRKIERESYQWINIERDYRYIDKYREINRYIDEQREINRYIDKYRKIIDSQINIE